MKRNLFIVLPSLLMCIILAVCVCIAVCYDFGDDSTDNLIHSHELALVGEKQATCTETGNVPYYACGICGKWFSDEMGEVEITDKSSVIIIKVHDLTPVEGKEATCTEDGSIDYYVCGECDKWFSDADGKDEITDKSNVIIIKSHDFRNGKCAKCGTEHNCKFAQIVTLPTCTTQGFTIYVCSCGLNYKDDYKEKLEHDYFNGKCRICGGEHDCKYTETVTEPTCTEQGFTTHACTCGRSFTDGYTDMLGHNYIDGECNRCGNCNYTVGLAYTLSNDGTYYICSGIGTATDTEIVIQSEYNSKPVKAIGDRAFKDCKTLNVVIIPDSITSIGLAAFQNSSLTEIVVPDSVKNIGNYAFYGCSNLTEITVPASVTALESYTFTSCQNLTQINFKGTVEQWQTIPHTDWLYISYCTVICTDGTLTAGR